MFFSTSHAPVNVLTKASKESKTMTSKFVLRDLCHDTANVQTTFAQDLRTFKSCLSFLLEKCKLKIWPDDCTVIPRVATLRKVGYTKPSTGLSIRPVLTCQDHALNYLWKCFVECEAGTSQGRQRRSRQDLGFHVLPFQVVSLQPPAELRDACMSDVHCSYRRRFETRKPLNRRSAAGG